MRLDVFNRRGEIAVQLDGVRRPPRCVDYDADCAEIGNDVGPGDHGFRSHLECHLYDPAKGYCPYLSQP